MPPTIVYQLAEALIETPAQRRVRAAPSLTRREQIQKTLGGTTGPKVLVSDVDSAKLFQLQWDRLSNDVKDVYRSPRAVATVSFEPPVPETRQLGSYRFADGQLTLHLTQPTGTIKGRTGANWLVETITHEAGHAVETLTVEPGGRTEIDTFASALYGTPETMITKPGQVGIYSQVIPRDHPELQRAVTDYGRTNIHEDFAETYTFYQLAPDGLRNTDPDRYKVMHEIVTRQRKTQAGKKFVLD